MVVMTQIQFTFRIQADADSDQNTEGSRPYAGWFIDEIVFRGTEKSHVTWLLEILQLIRTLK